MPYCGVGRGGWGLLGLRTLGTSRLPARLPVDEASRAWRYLANSCASPSSVRTRV